MMRAALASNAPSTTRAVSRTKGFMRPYKDGISVGAARPEKGDCSAYQGPIADIEWDSDFLYITTDPYEGNALLNIEALPYLRRALARVAKEIANGKVKSRTAPRTPEGFARRMI